MIYRTLGNTGYKVSAVSYGGIVSSRDGQDSSDRYVSWAIDRGINYFDVAPVYDDAQEKLGKSLEPYRKDVYLACKTNIRTRKGAEEDMHESLKLLRTDYFDLYQIHGFCSTEEVDTAFGPGGVMELLIEMKEKGIARKLGITAHSEEAALKAISLYPFDTVLYPFNWNLNMASGLGNRLIETAKEKGMGVLCMKSMIERAFIEGGDEEARKKYPKSWCKPFDVDTEPQYILAAVRYALSLGVDTIIPPGDFAHFSFAVDHIEELLEKSYGPQDEALLKKHLQKVKAYPFIDFR